MPKDPVSELQKQINKLRTAIKELSNLAKGPKSDPAANIAALEQELALRQQIHQFATMQATAEQDVRSLQEARMNAYAEETARRRNLGELSNEELRVRNEILNTFKQIANTTGDVSKETEEIVEELRNQLETARSINREWDKGIGAVRSLGSELLRVVGVGKDFDETVLGKMSTSFNFLIQQTGEILDRLKKAKIDFAGIADSAVVQKLAGTVSTVTKELFFAQDKLRSEFYASTGALAEFWHEARSVGEEMRKAGLGFESWMRVVPALRDNIAAFRNGTTSTRVELQKFTGMLEESYHAGDQGSKMLGFLTDSMGMSATSATRTTRSFMDLASALNINVVQAISNFNTVAPSMAMWGGRLVEVLEGLQRQSGATGVAMQQLVSIGDQFSTFERAADTAGRLNAILGQTIFSSIDMIFMSHEKRIQHIHSMLRDVGVTWNELGAYEKQAISTTLNFQNVGEAAAFFKNSLEKQNAEVLRAQAHQRSFSQLIKSSQTLMVQLANTVRQLAIDFGPLAEKLGAVLGFLSQILTAGNGWVGMAVLFGAATLKMVSSLASLSANFAITGLAASGATSKVSMFARAGRGALTTAVGLGAIGYGGTGGNIAGGALTGAGIGSMFGPGGAAIGGAIGGIGGAIASFQTGGTIPVETTMVNARTGRPYAVSHAGETIVPRGGGGPSPEQYAATFVSAVRTVRSEEPPPTPVTINLRVGEQILESVFTNLHARAHQRGV